MNLLTLLLAVLFLPAQGAYAFDPIRADARLTPGMVDPDATKEAICTAGYTKRVRHVPAKVKKEVYKRYRMAPNASPCPCEVDHLISLELGGSNDIENLWPEPYGDEMGARKKDVVENRLHKEVCNGAISLKRAQEIIGTDWTACYRTIKRGSDCR